MRQLPGPCHLSMLVMIDHQRTVRKMATKSMHRPRRDPTLRTSIRAACSSVRPSWPRFMYQMPPTNPTIATAAKEIISGHHKSRCSHKSHMHATIATPASPNRMYAVSCFLRLIQRSHGGPALPVDRVMSPPTLDLENLHRCHEPEHG